MDTVTVVIPCFNEAENIPELHRRLSAACAGHTTEFVFVNDGSTDATGAVLQDLKKRDARVRIISLVKNSGHQAALRAGLRQATGDLVITLDADLQQPPEEIPAMISAAGRGFDVISMVHPEPQRGFVKNLCSRGFSRIFSAVSGVRLQPGASDFRLVSARVVRVVNMLPERRLFLRAVLPHLGFPQTTLTYALAPRQHGKPGYTFGKSLAMAVDALFSFSTVPIRVMFGVGLLAAGAAFVYGLVNVGFRIFTDRNVPGYTDIVASVLFLGGLNLAMLAVVGKYLQVVLEHLKNRPEYLIDSRTSDLPPDKD